MRRQKNRSMKGRQRLGIFLRILLGVLFIGPVLVALLYSFVPDELLMGGMPSFS